MENCGFEDEGGGWSGAPAEWGIGVLACPSCGVLAEKNCEGRTRIHFARALAVLAQGQMYAWLPMGSECAVPS